MRGAVLGSAGFHVVLLLVLFLVRTPAPLIVPGPQVVQVSLISPEAQERVTPVAAPKPPPRAERATIRPEAGEGVRIAPPKPKPAPPATTPPVAPAETPALPYTRVGTAGLSGKLTLDSQDFEFTYYLLLVRNRIAQSWTPPAGLAPGQRFESVAFFQIERDGSVRAVRLEAGSGMEGFDRSVVRAVTLSDPLPPLPLGYTGARLGVHFGFQWGAK